MFSRLKGNKNEGKRKKPTRLATSAGSRIGSDSFNMDDKLHFIWSKGIDATVMKDLPRLIKRVEVITQTEAQEEIEEEEQEEEQQPQVPPPAGSGEGYDYFYAWLTEHLPADRNKIFRAANWGGMEKQVALTLTVKEKHIQLNVFEGDRRIYALPIASMSAVRDSSRYFLLDVNYNGERGEGEQYVGIAFNDRQTANLFHSALHRAGQSLVPKRAAPSADNEEEEEVVQAIRGSQILDLRNLNTDMIRFLLRAGITRQELEDPETVKILIRTIREYQEEEKEKKKLAKKARKPTESGGGGGGGAAAGGSTSGGGISGGGDGDGGGILSVIKDGLVRVASCFEDAAKVREISEKLDAVVQRGYVGDMELLMPEVFRIIGEDSKTARVFKMITQNVIFIPIIVLKTEVTKTDLMTKDDSSFDGWRVFITFTQDAVTIQHVRKEMPLAVAKADEKQFYYRWQLTMKFDRDMNELKFTQLRIIELHFDDGINPKYREKLSKLLGNGDMIIC